jgi:broad specificity polyphosphatase/5'/3'-nucleotidase SurE
VVAVRDLPSGRRALAHPGHGRRRRHQVLTSRAIGGAGRWARAPGASRRLSTERDIAAGTQPTIAAFPATAEFVVDAIETLQRSARGALLPDGQALNINFPVVTVGDGLPDGVSLTQVGEWSLFETHYQPVAPGTYVVVPGLLPFDERVRNADATALAADRISISVLDGDLGAGLLASGQTFLRLSPLLRR